MWGSEYLDETKAAVKHEAQTAMHHPTSKGAVIGMAIVSAILITFAGLLAYCAFRTGKCSKSCFAAIKSKIEGCCGRGSRGQRGKERESSGFEQNRQFNQTGPLYDGYADRNNGTGYSDAQPYSSAGPSGAYDPSKGYGGLGVVNSYQEPAGAAGYKGV